MSRFDNAVLWARQFVGQGGVRAEDEQWAIWDRYQHRPGINDHAFCGVFVSNVLHRAGWTPPQSWTLVSDIAQWGRDNHCYHTGIYGVQRGDVLIYNVPSGHTGIALGSEQNGHVQAIEGNTTNHTGFFNHFIEIKERPASFVVGYVRVPQIAAEVQADPGVHGHSTHHGGSGHHGTPAPGHTGHVGDHGHAGPLETSGHHVSGGGGLVDAGGHHLGEPGGFRGGGFVMQQGMKRAAERDAAQEAAQQSERIAQWSRWRARTAPSTEYTVMHYPGGSVFRPKTGNAPSLALATTVFSNKKQYQFNGQAVTDKDALWACRNGGTDASNPLAATETACAGHGHPFVTALRRRK